MVAIRLRVYAKYVPSVCARSNNICNFIGLYEIGFVVRTCYGTLDRQKWHNVDDDDNVVAMKTKEFKLSKFFGDIVDHKKQNGCRMEMSDGTAD